MSPWECIISLEAKRSVSRGIFVWCLLDELEYGQTQGQWDYTWATESAKLTTRGGADGPKGSGIAEFSL